VSKRKSKKARPTETAKKPKAKLHDGEAKPKRKRRRSVRHAEVEVETRAEVSNTAAPPSFSDAPPSGAFEDVDVDELGIGSRIVPPGLDFGEHDWDEEPPRERAHVEDVDFATQIRALEARLDGMIRGTGLDATSLAEEPEAHSDVVASKPARGSGQEELFKRASRELLDNEYYVRQWGRLGLRDQAEDVDDFGLDPELEKKVAPLAEFLFRYYFRTTVEGLENVPSSGRCVVVANHSGALPFDGAMLRAAVRLNHPSRRDLRWLAEDFVFYLPFVGTLLNRLGAVRACPENAERLLSRDALVAVFPEGEKGTKKLYKDRYHLQRFGRGGFVRLCLRTGAPLVPCAIVGAEETHPLLYRLEYLPKLIGLPYLPITPTFPWLGPLGLAPTPAKWRICFGQPIELSSYGRESADDDVLVGRLSDQIRDSIREMLDRSLRQRKNAWL
jgi:1-acyl-sn-glycerol-3-phosphate acyltransferase